MNSKILVESEPGIGSRFTVEVPVGPVNGLDHDSVVNLDNVATIPRSQLGQRIGWLLPSQEAALSAAVQAAFDLDDPV